MGNVSRCCLWKIKEKKNPTLEDHIQPPPPPPHVSSLLLTFLSLTLSVLISKFSDNLEVVCHSARNRQVLIGQLEWSRARAARPGTHNTPTATIPARLELHLNISLQLLSSSRTSNPASQGLNSAHFTTHSLSYSSYIRVVDPPCYSSIRYIVKEEIMFFWYTTGSRVGCRRVGLPAALPDIAWNHRSSDGPGRQKRRDRRLRHQRSILLLWPHTEIPVIISDLIARFMPLNAT